MDEWIMGKNPLAEALQAGRTVNKIWIADNLQKGAAQEIIQLAKQQGATVQRVPRQKLDQLVQNSNHQGVVASVAATDFVEPERLIEIAREKGEPPFLFILDELEDPHNLGSVLRTADASGVHGVIIPKRRSVGLTPAVAKASAGALEYVPVARVTNIAQTIDWLKEQGVWVFGTDSKAKEDYRQAKYDMPLAIVVGNEGKGISRLVKEKCDFLVSLPMRGSVPSLNVSVAAGLLMYEVLRQRIPAADFRTSR